MYDRRDVHIRDTVRELPLKGLSLEATEAWLSSLETDDTPPAKDVHAATGGHPLAMELLELYGQPTHNDWLRFPMRKFCFACPNRKRSCSPPLPWRNRR